MRRDPAILLLAVGETLVWASIYYIFPALLLRWEQDLGWSKAELTVSISLAVLISAVASPMMGRVIDRGFGALAVAFSAFLGGICLILLSLVTELWQFQLVWSLMGVAMAGCLYEPIFALVIFSTDSERISWRSLITDITNLIGNPWIMPAGPTRARFPVLRRHMYLNEPIFGAIKAK